ncbi:MAG TPA: hypothetical protein PKK06_05275 [Phycisphaerae bacterium]|nr:hypothetical protein [Phycisphaerae bacterium]HNU44832.1 hypothetical protein [Phycisphaerae bacterium]
MSANVYMKSVLLDTADVWVRLAASPLILNATFIVRRAGFGISADPHVQVRYRGGAAELWPLETQAELTHVDLSEFEFCLGNDMARVFVVAQSGE